MSKFNTTRLLTVGAFVAAASISILSLGSNAEASTSVFSCEGTTAKQVVSCCHEMTRDHRPYWMIRTGKNCEQISVVCHAKATYSTAAGVPGKKCYAKNDDDNPNDGGDGPKRSGSPGPNNPSSSPQ